MYRLQGYRSAQFELEIRGDDSEEDCFSAVLGANGSGKSRLLGELARTAIGQVKGIRRDTKQAPTKILAVSNMVTDAFPFVRQKLPGYRYLGLRQSSNSMTTGAIASSLGRFYAETLLDQQFPFEIDRIASRLNLPPVQLVLGRGPSVSNRATRGELVDRLAAELESGSIAPTEALIVVDRQIRDIAEEVHRHRPLPFDGADRIALIRTLASSVRVEPGVMLDAMRRVYGLRFELEFDGEGGRSFEPSAGQALLLSMILRIASSIQPNSLILVDEPETGLHPAWQSGFVNLLRESLPRGLGCHFVLATHSPYVALAATNILVPDDHMLDGVRRFAQLESDHRGMSVETLIYRVFGAHVIGSASVNSDLTKVLGWLSSGERATDIAHRYPCGSVSLQWRT